MPYVLVDLEDWSKQGLGKWKGRKKGEEEVGERGGKRTERCSEKNEDLALLFCDLIREIYCMILEEVKE